MILVLGRIVPYSNAVGVIAEDKSAAVFFGQTFQDIAFIKALGQERKPPLINNARHGQPCKLDVRVDGKGHVAEVADIFQGDTGLYGNFVINNVIVLIVDPGGKQVVVIFAEESNGEDLYMGFDLLL